MMSLSVVNGKVEGFENCIYIGRGGKGKKGSPLANPFKIGKDTREQVISKYRVWLWEQIQSGGVYKHRSQVAVTTPRNQAVIDELNRIRNLAKTHDVKLACFCSPLPCHGDIIIRCIHYLDSLNR
ncbi:DUF4326 domain-containing protein [Cyanobacterium aponinum AL20118]|uniref:DUF4326 domain-containing protein n=1 Tax=Cyanobacterium aponinum AL20115 TaxID=3090662 RepID=A0AAF0Z8Q2_9CHRO|nr:DUF4326 domain-containing protein [Cyanobacterium aponinum]WPF87546.1 DUF4326 domain-containing protein [Cyanobacterium aponinum AL20115]